jgi:poly-gamma-glutamate synthesis protein (capsule biosynthesis protein)
MARWPREIRPRLFRVNGVTVSHLAYTFGYNGLRPPPGQEWRSALIDPARIRRNASRARARGADVVIVSLHWGVEGLAEPTAAQRSVARAITAGGLIDLVVGHHAHVLQPIQRVNGTWVIYGLGNILSNMPTAPSWPASTQDGAVAVARFVVDPDGQVRVLRPVIHPTWVDRSHGWIVRLVQQDLARPRIGPWLRSQLLASRRRSAGVLGAFFAPL